MKVAVKKQKRELNETIDKLIVDGVIKNRAQLAKELGYSKGFLSITLNESNPKQVSNVFLLKFKSRFFTKEVETQAGELVLLSKKVSVLTDLITQILYTQTGKNIPQIKSEIEDMFKRL